MQPLIRDYLQPPAARHRHDGQVDNTGWSECTKFEFIRLLDDGCKDGLLKALHAL